MCCIHVWVGSSDVHNQNIYSNIYKYNNSMQWYMESCNVYINICIIYTYIYILHTWSHTQMYLCKDPYQWGFDAQGRSGFIKWWLYPQFRMSESLHLGSILWFCGQHRACMEPMEPIVDVPEVDRGSGKIASSRVVSQQLNGGWRLTWGLHMNRNLKITNEPN